MSNDLGIEQLFKLSEENLNELMSQTNYDEFTIREWYNCFIQDCPNGKLTLSKCTDLHKIILPNKNTEQLCRHLIELFDKDNSGYIDFKEFIHRYNLCNMEWARYSFNLFGRVL